MNLYHLRQLNTWDEGKNKNEINNSDVNQIVNNSLQMSTELIQHKTLLTNTMMAGWGLLFETLNWSELVNLPVHGSDMITT